MAGWDGRMLFCAMSGIQSHLATPVATITEFAENPDKLRSYAAAKREVMPDVEHRQSRYLNNRANASHQPTRRPERQTPRFKSARHAQRFLSAHSRIHNLFQLRRHRLTANAYRAVRNAAFRMWRDVTRVEGIA